MADSYHAHKRFLILNLIHHLGPISRTQLTQLADYRPASVGEITKELLEENQIVESGRASSGHGRKRAMLEINRDYLCAIGLAFFSDSVTYIVTQIDGTLLLEGQIPNGAAVSKETLANRILEQVRALLAQFSDREIVGIGICDPLYDPASYQIENSLSATFAHFNDWLHLGLMPRLEEISSVPVRAFSAVTLPALAERRFGVAKGKNDFICVELSNGIGASICCGGVVVAGTSGVAGELGHTVIDCGDPNPKLCYCGKPGCVENSTAYRALAGEITAALDRGVFSALNSYYDRKRPLTVLDIRKALDQNDQMCVYFVKRTAERLGIVIANAVNLLNPELIVLYGFMVGLGDVFLQCLETSIRANVLSLSQRFEIEVSDSLERILPLGAVVELFSEYLKMEDYRWIYELKPEDLESEGEMEE